MKRFSPLLPVAACLTILTSGCAGWRTVPDYDEVVDRGIADFSEQLGAHARNMAELGGLPEGTYQANLRVYNLLDARLDTLIARTRNGADGKGCKLQAEAFDRIKAQLQDRMPAVLQSGADATAGSANECNARLLVLVKGQLADLREIHRDLDKCGPAQLSCLRPATAKDALDIALQSANAVAVVEAAKKAR